MNRFCALFITFLFALPIFAYESDFLVDNYLSNDIEKPVVNSDYDYTSIKRIPILLSIKNEISTKRNDIYEGQNLEFVVKKDVFCNRGLILRKGDIVHARIETIVTSGMNGIPYYIYFGDFDFPGIDNSKVFINYYKSGRNRTYFVLPLKWALTFLPPTGSLTNFIMGGHAKITPKEVITAYYYPDWK